MGEIMLVAVTSAGRRRPDGACARSPTSSLRPQLLTIPGRGPGHPDRRRGPPVPRHARTRRRCRRSTSRRDRSRQAIGRFGTNTGGGFVDQHAREYLIRNVGLHDNGSKTWPTLSSPRARDQPMLLRAGRRRRFRGRASNAAMPASSASRLSSSAIQKQPAADTVAPDPRASKRPAGPCRRRCPTGVSANNVQFRQATFIETLDRTTSSGCWSKRPRRGRRRSVRCS